MAHASLLPSWVPKAWLPLPCPLLPPGAGGLAVISSPDQKHARGLLEVSYILKSCTHERGRTRAKEPIQEENEQGEPPPQPSETGWSQTGQLRLESGLSSADSTVVARRSDREGGGEGRDPAAPNRAFPFSGSPGPSPSCTLPSGPVPAPAPARTQEFMAQQKGSQRWLSNIPHL